MRACAGAEGAQTHFDHDGTLVEPESNVVTPVGVSDAPASLEAVVERVLKAVRARVPDLDGTVLRSRDNDGEQGVKDGERDVGRVPFEDLNARLGVVVPDLDEAVPDTAGEAVSTGAEQVSSAVKWQPTGRHRS